MGLQLIPAETSFSFVRVHKLAFVITVLAMVASVVSLYTQGLNFGIDFKGGTVIEVHTEGPADLGKIRDVVGQLDLGETQVQEFGAPDQVMVRVQATKGSEAAEIVKDALRQNYGPDISFQRVEVVGPKVSDELIKGGLVAVGLSLVFMAAYIGFRFEWQFAIGATLALLHDVILTLGMFSLLQLEFNLAVVAALLTIVGYSMNDTVVVFDRVRETMKRYRKRPMDEIIDRSINDTLSRTVMVSVTTLLAIFAFYFLGGEVLRGFSFALIFGVIVGTYSSIFVASPVLLYTNAGANRTLEDAPTTP